MEKWLAKGRTGRRFHIMAHDEKWAGKRQNGAPYGLDLQVLHGARSA
jgi:hypothetical protein